MILTEAYLEQVREKITKEVTVAMMSSLLDEAICYRQSLQEIAEFSSDKRAVDSANIALNKFKK